MSGVTTLTYVAIATAAASTYVSYQNGQDQKEAAKNAQQQAQANADKQEKAADQATNRENQKKPNLGAILDAATQAGKGGASGTMLTGPQGIDPASLTLGRNTLLGK